VFEPQGAGFFLLLIVVFGGLLIWVALARQLVFRVLAACLAFLPAMVKRRQGAILNVASIAGFQPLPNQATYGATKAFAVSFSEAIHTDLHGTGVSCTALCPGPVRTEFTEVAGMTELDDTGPEFVWMQPADVAKAGIDGMVKGRRIVYPSIAHQAAAW